MCSGSSSTSASGLVRELRRALGDVDLDHMDDHERLALLRANEDLTRSLAAVSIRTQKAFADSQVAEQAAAAVPARKRGLAVADDIAHARKISPSMSSRELSSAKALVDEMPLTLQALADGTINAYQSRIITEATSCLEQVDRREVDERLQAALVGASNAEIGKAVRALVYEVDPAGFVRRARRAAKDRGLSVRPAPDVMAILSARLPAPQAVACYAALRSHAAAARASGDPRSLNQLMADELYFRLTGRTVVDGVDVEVGLVMTDAALFDGASDAADLEGYGPIPAEMARDLLRQRSAAAGEGQSAAEVDQNASGAEADEDASRAEADDDASRAEADEHQPGSATGDEDASYAEAPAGHTGPARAGSAAVTDGAPAMGPGAVQEFCADGSRCTSWDCDKVHGVASAATSMPGRHPPPPPSAPPSPPAAPSAPPSPPGSGPSCGSRPGAVIDGAARAWLRRLYVDPATGVLTGRDSRRRLFTGSLRAFLVARDRTCRNSWCGAPIRDIDHIRRHRDGGATDADNGRGLCHRCNLARERERHHEPAPDSYLASPPAVHTLLGRQRPRAPAPGESGREVA